MANEQQQVAQSVESRVNKNDASSKADDTNFKGMMNGEQELATKMLHIQPKRFYLDVKENRRGRFIKIAEVGAGGRKSRLLMSMSSVADFKAQLGKFAEFYVSLGKVDAQNTPDDGLLKSEVMVKENRRYYLDLKENNRGRFLRVTQTWVRGGGPRCQIAIPAQGIVELRDALSELLDEYGKSESSSPADQLPDGKQMRVDNKLFYFDVSQNSRGVFMRVSEVMVKSGYRSSITIPERSWPVFRDYFAEFCEKAKLGEQEHHSKTTTNKTTNSSTHDHNNNQSHQSGSHHGNRNRRNSHRNRRNSQNQRRSSSTAENTEENQDGENQRTETSRSQTGSSNNSARRRRAGRDEKSKSGDEKSKSGDEKSKSGDEKSKNDDEKLKNDDEKLKNGDEKSQVGAEKSKNPASSKPKSGGGGSGAEAGDAKDDDERHLVVDNGQLVDKNHDKGDQQQNQEVKGQPKDGPIEGAGRGEPAEGGASSTSDQLQTPASSSTMSSSSPGSKSDGTNSANSNSPKENE